MDDWTRPLGRTGEAASVVGFGAAEMRGLPHGRLVEEATVGRLLNGAIDAGINLIDTSIDYGVSEERIGRHVAHRRDEYLLATKCGCLVDADPDLLAGDSQHDYTRTNIRAGLEQSLRRLRTDHVDILQLHFSPSATEIAQSGTIEALEELRDEGKIRYLGVSSTVPNIADHVALGAFDVFQIPYSLLEPQHDTWITRAAEHGAGVVVRGGVARGAVRNGAPAERGADLAAVWELARLDELLGGISPIEFVLRYTITHPGVATVIVGTLVPEHLVANVEAARRGPLPRDLYEESTHRVTEATSAISRAENGGPDVGR